MATKLQMHCEEVCADQDEIRDVQENDEIIQKER